MLINEEYCNSNPQFCYINENLKTVDYPLKEQ